MAPYRPSREQRRAGRVNLVDHDVFEGLPVRQWGKHTVQVCVPPKNEIINITASNNRFMSELPMPKDSHLLNPMSRALLQAARAGKVQKPTPAPSEEEAGAKEPVEEEEAVKVDDDRGFVAKRWAIIPKHLEGAEREYLAKRRKGLRTTTAVGAVVPEGGNVIKRKQVRRLDAEGNSFVEEVVVPEGQKVEGEVIAEVTMTDTSAPGTIIEGVGIVNSEGIVVAAQVETPVRKRPPPPRPKKKLKGPGRGRKKKVVQFVPGDIGTDGAPSAPIAGVLTAEGQVIVEGVEVKVVTTREGDGDVDMGDDTNMPDDDDEGEDGDEGDEGEDGEEGEDDDREEGELTDMEGSPSKSPPKSIATILPPLDGGIPSSLPSKPDFTNLPPVREPSSSPDLPLAQSVSPVKTLAKAPFDEMPLETTSLATANAQLQEVTSLDSHIPPPSISTIDSIHTPPKLEAALVLPPAPSLAEPFEPIIARQMPVEPDHIMEETPEITIPTSTPVLPFEAPAPIVPEFTEAPSKEVPPPSIPVIEPELGPSEPTQIADSPALESPYVPPETIEPAPDLDTTALVPDIVPETHAEASEPMARFPDREVDLFGSLEKHLDEQREKHAESLPAASEAEPAVEAAFPAPAEGKTEQESEDQTKMDEAP